MTAGTDRTRPTLDRGPDPHRRSVAYWLTDLTGVVPLVAPLLVEATIHMLFARTWLHMGAAWALLLPASIGLGAIWTAFYLDRAKLRGARTAMARTTLYGYMAAGFGLSFWTLTHPAPGGPVLLDHAELPAVVFGLAQVGSVVMWELRVRQRRNEVEHAREWLRDPDRYRRWLDRARIRIRFPRWSGRMVRYQLITGLPREEVVRRFAPLILTRMARKPDRYPPLTGPVWPEPTSDGPDQTTAPDQAKTPARVVRMVRTDEKTIALLVTKLAGQFPDEVPSRQKATRALDVPWRTADRIRTILREQRTATDQAAGREQAR